MGKENPFRPRPSFRHPGGSRWFPGCRQSGPPPVRRCRRRNRPRAGKTGGGRSATAFRGGFLTRPGSRARIFQIWRPPFRKMTWPWRVGRVRNPPLPGAMPTPAHPLTIPGPGQPILTGPAPGTTSPPGTISAPGTKSAHGELVEPSTLQGNHSIKPSFRRKPESRKSPGKERVGYRGFWIPAFAGTTVAPGVHDSSHKIYINDISL